MLSKGPIPVIRHREKEGIDLFHIGFSPGQVPLFSIGSDNLPDKELVCRIVYRLDQPAFDTDRALPDHGSSLQFTIKNGKQASLICRLP
jgi:hypothetical protein